MPPGRGERVEIERLRAVPHHLGHGTDCAQDSAMNSVALVLDVDVPASACANRAITYDSRPPNRTAETNDVFGIVVWPDLARIY